MLKKLTLSAGIFCFIIAASAESTLLQHDFANGWQKMDKEKFARKIQISVRGKTPEFAEGKTENGKVMRLLPGSQLILKNARPQVPGSIVLKLKVSGNLTPSPARYIGTTNIPGPYLFYQESISLKKNFTHFGCHNLRAPSHNQYNITKHDLSLPQNTWSTIVINLKKDVIELWINGKKYNGKQNDFQNNELYGDLALGSVSNKNMTIDIASLSVFSDTLPDAEIQKISQK